MLHLKWGWRIVKISIYGVIFNIWGWVSLDILGVLIKICNDNFLNGLALLRMVILTCQCTMCDDGYIVFYSGIYRLFYAG